MPDKHIFLNPNHIFFELHFYCINSNEIQRASASQHNLSDALHKFAELFISLLLLSLLLLLLLEQIACTRMSVFIGASQL